MVEKGRRDYALLALLFGGGLRRSEALYITIADVKKTKSGTFFVELRATKAKKDASQAIPDWTGLALEAVIADRKKHGASSGDPLFIGYRGRAGVLPSSDPLSETGLYLLFKGYSYRAGAGAFVSPHSARATAITKLLDEGITHRDVKEFSRHSSVQMVEVYDKRRTGIDMNPGVTLRYGKKTHK